MRPRWGPCAAWGFVFPVGAPDPGPPGGAQPVASAPVLGGGVLPRANAASSAVEQHGPGHRAPCGLISRQARHTRSPWVSSHKSGGAAPVDRCTDRRWDTNDCRQLTSSVRPPRGVRTAALGRTTIPKGGWRMWSVAVVGGCWVGTGASPAPLTRARPFPWGPLRRAGPHVHLRACRRETVQGRFNVGRWGGLAGHHLYLPARTRAPIPDRSPQLPPGGPSGRDPPREGEVPPVLGRPDWNAPPPAAGRGTGVSRRGAPARKGGAWWPTVW